MLRTIVVGSCVSVQGLMVGQMSDGKIMARSMRRPLWVFPLPSFALPDLSHAMKMAGTLPGHFLMCDLRLQVRKGQASVR
jgi:hypothetical protein